LISPAAFKAAFGFPTCAGANNTGAFFLV